MEYHGIEIKFNETAEKFFATVKNEEISESDIKRIKRRIDGLLTEKTRAYLIDYSDCITVVEIIRKTGNHYWISHEGRRNTKEWAQNLRMFNKKGNKLFDEIVNLHKQKSKIAGDIRTKIDQMDGMK